MRDFAKTSKILKRIPVALNPYEISCVKQLKEIPDPECKLYHLLKKKRLYPISREFIKQYGSSILDIDILNESRFNWKYHCKNTPFWKNKFNSTKEEDLDYDLEFDEQPLECQLKSCLKIELK